MKPTLFLLATVLAASASAKTKVRIDDSIKAEVQLRDSGYSTSGGSRREVPEVSVKKGLFAEPMPLAEQIAALESATCFCRLLQQQGVNPETKVTDDYTGMRLKDVLTRLLPAMPVEFSDVDEEVTVLKMTVEDARLQSVLEALDDGAGVYFTYTMAGLTVSAEPR